MLSLLSPVFAGFHAINSRIQYKVALAVFLIRTNQCPTYLSDIVIPLHFILIKPTALEGYSLSLAFWPLTEKQLTGRSAEAACTAILIYRLNLNFLLIILLFSSILSSQN
jgi:hypothetical protein